MLFKVLHHNKLKQPKGCKIAFSSYVKTDHELLIHEFDKTGKLLGIKKEQM